MSGADTLILLAHGSRTEAAFAEMQDLAGRMAALRERSPAGNAWKIRGAFLSLTPPDLARAVADAIADGAREVRILPLFLFSGKHVLTDIPDQVEALRARHPGISIALLDPIGRQKGFEDFLLRAADLE